MSNSPGWDRQTRPKEGTPHGWIQWKGTNVCMDFHCACGFFGHFDGSFAYYLKCPECQQVYMTNGFIELVPLTDAEARTVEPKLVPPED